MKNIAENIKRNMSKIRSDTSKSLKAKEKKIKTMHDLLTSMKDKELIATEQQKILDHNFFGISKKLIESHTANAELWPNLNHYSDEVKQFAMTLHYYSPKANEFVCQVLKQPHTSRIWHWAASVNCEPGTSQMSSSSLGWLLKHIIQ